MPLAMIAGKAAGAMPVSQETDTVLANGDAPAKASA
jgi:hypothetical protein